jgi:hypothetical protein
MVKFKRTAVTSKTGVNFVRGIVEGAGCLFNKIEQENDVGIDALIELARDECPLNKQIAVQVKSGQSYYNNKGEQCIIPIEGHREYWAAYPLPVIGIVYVPSLNVAHWVDVKRHLRDYPGVSVIRFSASHANLLDATAFQTLFLPAMLGEIPDVSFDGAVALFHSPKPDESYLGLIVLFRRYPNSKETWDLLIDRFTTHPADQIPPILIYYLAHIPWHPDIYYVGESITPETEGHVRPLIHRFGRTEILKLLGFIDPENSLSRGSIGQSVEALISYLPNPDPVLEDLARDGFQDLSIREYAALILAMHVGKGAKPVLDELARLGSWYAAELARYVDDYGGVNPYR